MDAHRGVLVDAVMRWLLLLSLFRLALAQCSGNSGTYSTFSGNTVDFCYQYPAQVYTDAICYWNLDGQGYQLFLITNRFNTPGYADPDRFYITPGWDNTDITTALTGGPLASQAGQRLTFPSDRLTLVFASHAGLFNPDARLGYYFTLGASGYVAYTHCANNSVTDASTWSKISNWGEAENTAYYMAAEYDWVCTFIVSIPGARIQLDASSQQLRRGDTLTITEVLPGGNVTYSLVDHPIEYTLAETIVITYRTAPQATPWLDLSAGFFANVYSVGPVTLCSGLTMQNGTMGSVDVSSPAASVTYPPNTFCAWQISVPAGHTIQFYSGFVATTRGLDTLSIYDGTSTAAPRITALSSFVSTFNFVTSGSNAYVVFAADGIRDGLMYNPGFAIQYRAIVTGTVSPTLPFQVRQNQCSGVKTIQITGAGSFTLGIPNNLLNSYDLNLDCGWLLLAPVNMLITVCTIGTLSIANSESIDYYASNGPDPAFLYAQDAGGSTGGNNPIASSTVFVSFRSDGSAQGNGWGFTVRYEALPGLAPCSSDTPIPYPGNSFFYPILYDEDYGGSPLGCAALAPMPNVDCIHRIDLGPTTPLQINLVQNPYLTRATIEVRQGTSLNGTLLTPLGTYDQTHANVAFRTTGPVIIRFRTDSTPPIQTLAPYYMPFQYNYQVMSPWFEPPAGGPIYFPMGYPAQLYYQSVTGVYPRAQRDVYWTFDGPSSSSLSIDVSSYLYEGDVIIVYDGTSPGPTGTILKTIGASNYGYQTTTSLSAPSVPSCSSFTIRWITQANAPYWDNYGAGAGFTVSVNAYQQPPTYDTCGNSDVSVCSETYYMSAPYDYAYQQLAGCSVLSGTVTVDPSYCGAVVIGVSTMAYGSSVNLNAYNQHQSLSMPNLRVNGGSISIAGQIDSIDLSNVYYSNYLAISGSSFSCVNLYALNAAGYLSIASCTDLTTLNTPSLVSVNTLYIASNNELQTTNFNSLQYVAQLQFYNSYGGGDILLQFPRLTLVRFIQAYNYGNLIHYDFPALQQVDSTCMGYRSTLSFPSLVYAGSFVLTNSDSAVSLQVPALQYVSTLYLNNVGIQNLSLPSAYYALLRLTSTNLVTVDVSNVAYLTFILGGNNVLKTLTASNARAVGMSFLSGNLALLWPALPAVRTACVYLNNGNALITSVVLSNVTSARYVQITSLDVISVSAPRLVYAVSIYMQNSRIPVLGFPRLTTVMEIVLMQNFLLTALSMPQLTTIAHTLSLVDSGIVALSLPNLQSIGYDARLQDNPVLSALYLCRLAVVRCSFVVNTCPVLSCFETRNLLKGQPLMMTDDQCDASLVGSFGCTSNFTRTVNTTDCGFTVACIQEAIATSYSNSSVTVIVPAGTYRNCSSPLTFLGRSMIVRGAGMSKTIIDCEWHGTGFVANRGEGFDSSMSDLSFVRGNSSGSGGGFTISGASPSFARVAFTNNMAAGDGGAGLITNGQPSFYGCLFEGNMASTGGAVSLIVGAAPSFGACNFTANTASGSGGALAYSGAVSPAWLSDAYVSDNVAARGGGIYTDIAVQAARLTLQDNVATQYGGAIAAVPDAPTGVMLVASNLLVQGNAAPKGGAFFLYSCGLTLSASTVSGNQAISSGGAISAACSVTYRTLTGLVGPCDLTLNLTDARLLGNTVASGNGGALSAQDVRVVMDRVNASLNHAGGGGGALYIAASDVTATSSSVAFNSAGGNGGGVYCEARGICKLAGVTVENNRASLAGGGLFFCLSSCSDTGTGRVAPDVASSTFHDNSVDAAGYGAKIATDPAALTFEVPPANQVVSGFPLAPGADQSLRVLIQDNYGQTVSSTINVLQLFLHDENGLATDVVLSGSTTVLASAGDALFVGTTAVARAVSQTNQRYTLTCQHSSIANVLVSANFTLLPCQNGQGVPPEKEASGMFCADCTIGTYANADTNLTCVACAAGSIGTAPREANCSLCPADTFQPSPGTANCIPCADGASAPPGSVTCSSKPAAIVDGKDAGGISTTVYYIIGAILLCFILVCLVATRFVYKYSRRKTMEKYYLDEDATVRRGVGESSLALAVRKFITASTTTRIGGGEFTDVYKGRHEGQWIALKVLKGEMVGHAIAQSEFRREVIALSTMNAMKHPAIIELKFYLERSPVCIGLQFCPNGSLKRSLATMQLKDHDKVRMMAQLASAIVALHNHSIAHCDLKTDNILLDDDNNVRLADYGISRLLNQGDKASGSPYGTRGPSSGGGSNLDTFGTIDTMGGEDKSLYAGNPIFASMANSVALNTVTGAMTIISEIDEGDQAAFTPQYVDPYRLQHEDDMSDGALRRADVFSFGMVMWALAKQEEPFAGVDPVLLAEQRRDRPDMRPGELKDCHPCYERIMHRAWDTQPHARPTMAEVLVMLRTCLTDHFGADLPPAYLEVGESLPSADDNAHRSVAGFSAHSLGGATSQGGEDTGSDRFGGPVVHSGGSSVTAEMRDRGGSASGSGPGGAEYGATPPSAPMMAPQVFDSMVATTNGPVYVPPAGAAAANSMVFETSRSSNYLAGPPVPDETDAAASNAQLQVLQTSRGPPVRGASGAPAPAFSMATDGGGGGANNAPNGDPNGALASVMFPTMMGGRGSGMSDASGGIGGIGAMPAMGGLGGEDPTMFPTLHGPLPVPVKSPKPARG